jgi:hypothetical protein
VAKKIRLINVWIAQGCAMPNRTLKWSSVFLLWAVLLVLSASPAIAVGFGFLSGACLSIGTYRYQSELIRLGKPYSRQPKVISLALREPKQVGPLNASLIWLFHPGFFAAVLSALVLHISS